MIVAHDPGHGQPPAVIGCNSNGIVERDFVLKLAEDIAAGIDWPGLSQRLLRTSNDGPGCPDYHVRATKALGSDLVICHHVNASSDGAHGLITFYDDGDELGKAVAIEVARSAPPNLRRSINGVFAAKPTDWTKAAHWVLEHYRCLGIPACLIEWGFSTNADDARFLLDPAARPALIATVAAGLARAMAVKP